MNERTKPNGFGIAAAGLITALLIGVVFASAVNAQSDGRNDMFIVHIDGMTEKRANMHNLSELNIPSSIKKSDIVIFDLKKLDGLLGMGGKVPMHIKGKPYVMELNEIKVNAPGVNEGTFSYRGSIVGVEDSEIVLTFSDRALVGRITLDNVDYTIESIGEKDAINADKVLHVVYSSEDVVAEGGTIPVDSPLPGVTNSSTNSVVRLLNHDIMTRGMVDVGAIVATDNQWITDEPDWKTKAQNIIAEANNQLGRDDIQAHLTVYAYDDSKKDELSNDPNIISDPLGTFINHFPTSYLDSKSADIAIYLGGYDSTTGGVGSTWGYDSGAPKGRYAWTQMADDPSSYDATHHDRTVVTLHEIGHMFDADHQDAPGQGEIYNRAYQWTEWFFWTYQTVVWSPFDKDTRFEYSSDNYHGDANHDNARRISETKGTVSNYKP